MASETQAQTVLKILVADDSPTNVKQLEVVAKRLGHEVVTASDGAEAVQQFQATQPDLVFMDIMMPGMDGIAATQAIRQLPTERWVPVVFYSAMDRMEDIIRGLECGGDDYVVKPASLQLLRARINSYVRMLALQRQVHAYTAELKNWRQQAEEEVRLGTHIMARILENPGLRDPMLRHYNVPAVEFSGDILCAARGPGEVLYLMLADATGHGLPAALSALPLTYAFYGMTAKGFPLATIAAELNHKLKALLPSDRFVATTLAAIDVRNQTVEVWNGGNPDVLFISGEGQVMGRVRSHHPALGVMPEKLFSSDTVTLPITEPGTLFLCSDGLPDAEAPDGQPFSLDKIEQTLAARHGAGAFDGLLGALDVHLAGGKGHDDVSFMLAQVPLERREAVRTAVPSRESLVPMSDWRLAVSYGPQELRQVDIVPALLGLLNMIEVLKPHQGALFLIISELFNNALDHGLLSLDSRIKETTGGFDLYLHQRAERLHHLGEGRIDLSFDLHLIGQQPVLDIMLLDSGPGFDYASLLGTSMGGTGVQPHGRGILLVRSICQDMVYSEEGRKVWVRYAL